MQQELTTMSLARSALRHRPITPDAIQTQVQTPRASRARQKLRPYVPDDLAEDSATRAPIHASKASHRWLIHVVLGMLAAMVLLWIGEGIWSWGQKTVDDVTYGYPRTTNVDRFVGHEAGSTASHFTALNLKGQVYVIEIPGGSPNTSHLLVGPHLYGEGSDLAPVTLSFPGDPHHPNLLISIENIQVLFRNTGNAYVPAS